VFEITVVLNFQCGTNLLGCVLVVCMFLVERIFYSATLIVIEIQLFQNMLRNKGAYT
jgi:hypothetical protein